jgi:hypothetical protein
MEALAKAVLGRTCPEPPAPSARPRRPWYGIAAVLIVCIAVARIVSTYAEFTATFDEPFHIACGMQLLRQGIYTIELQHPPLARPGCSRRPPGTPYNSAMGFSMLAGVMSET